jgi:hypothetical protein
MEDEKEEACSTHGRDKYFIKILVRYSVWKMQCGRLKLG